MKEFIFGTIFGVLIFCLVYTTLIIVEENKFDAGADLANYYAINEATNNTVKGVWFPNSAFCINMNKKNIKELKNTLDHEFIHELINNNHTCDKDNNTCREHFCKI